MAINNNFYATINELVNRATGEGATIAITDFQSFVDFGKSLADMTASDKTNFMNAFAAEIANKVKLSIDTARDYKGKFTSLIRGQMSANGVIEMITHSFYETREASFVSLIDGQSVDQYEINKGGQNVVYFTKDNAYQIPVTIQYLELEGAFVSPEAMNRFLDAKIRYALNSNELAREEGRLGLVDSLIKEIDAGDAATTVEEPAQKYPLVTLYNATYGAELTADTALYNGEFIKFAVNMIKKVKNKLAHPSISYNLSGIKTFTPKTEEDQKLMVIGALDGGIETYVMQDVRRPEALGAYEVVPFWQNEETPFVIGDEEIDGAVSSPIVAVLFDKYALGEYVCHEAVRTTPFNARGEYFNNWINVQTKYVMNSDANAVIFTLD